MSTEDLFDWYTRCRANDHDTSIAAAISLSDDRLTDIQNAVMSALRKAPDGLTDLELWKMFGGPESTYRKRRTELTQKGYVIDTGRRRLLAGRHRIVWALKGPEHELHH